jgi:hypothetical protein
MSSNNLSILENSNGNVDDSNLVLLERSMIFANRYPTNIVYPRNYDYQLEEYERQLSDDRSKLFGRKNVVDLLEFREVAEGIGKLIEEYLRFGDDQHKFFRDDRQTPEEQRRFACRRHASGNKPV